MAEAKFTPAPGLNEKVAWMVAPKVRDIAKKVEDEARRLAPPTKKWISMADNRVRDTHVEAHADSMLHELPSNLRFAVRGQPWDITHGLSPGVDYMLEPKDTSGGLPADAVQIIHCRCAAALNPVGLADKIITGPAIVTGSTVRVEVYCEAYKVVEAEYGDTYDGGMHSPGTRFMSRAAAKVAGRAGVVHGFETGGSSVGRTDMGAGGQ